MSDGPKEGYAFIIDTDSYAGNFEREMCAYLTSEIGECGVGDVFIEKLPISFSDSVKQVPDEHGCHRPCAIWIEPTTKRYNSVAIFFYEQPEIREMIFMKDRVGKFNTIFEEKSWKRNTYQPINILGFRLIQFISQEIEMKI